MTTKVDERATYSPVNWAVLGLGGRTMETAHKWIIQNFSGLQDGDVVDVEFILGETSTKKVSERLEVAK